MLRITLGAALLSAVAIIPADAQRVCRQDCIGPVCTEKCTENSGAVIIERDRNSTDGRGYRDRDPGVVIEERRRNREPGIELRAPGVDVEIGR